MVFDFHRVPEIKVNVLGVESQAFIDPQTNRAVFSQRGTARALKMPKTSLTRILKSEAFKRLRGGDFPCPRLRTTVSSIAISVVTQSDLILIVQIAAEKGFPVAISMQDASFAILLQESVDQALGIERNREEYIQAGTQLRLQLESHLTQPPIDYQLLRRANSSNLTCIPKPDRRLATTSLSRTVPPCGSIWVKIPVLTV